jgi:hypothetical protein
LLDTLGLHKRPQTKLGRICINSNGTSLITQPPHVFKHLDPNMSLGKFTIQQALQKVVTTVRESDSERLVFIGIERSQVGGTILVYERQYQPNVDVLIYNFQEEMERINGGPIPDCVIPALQRNNPNRPDDNLIASENDSFISDITSMMVGSPQQTNPPMPEDQRQCVKLELSLPTHTGITPTPNPIPM